MMKLKTLLAVCAQLGVLALWAAVGVAAHRSLDEHEAKRKARETPPPAAVAISKIADERVKE